MAPQKLAQEIPQVQHPPEKDSAPSLTASESIRKIHSSIAQLHVYDTPVDYLTIATIRPDREIPWGQVSLLPEQWNDPAQELLPGLLDFMLEDVYVSQHSYNQPNRRAANVSKLNDLFLDIDHDRHDPPIPREQALARAFAILEENGIPMPTLWRDSGRGFYFIWLLEDTPATAESMATWQRIEDNLIPLFEDVGIDPVVKDFARVLRAEGGINSKNGATVTDHQLSGKRFTLQEMADVFQVVVRKRKKKTKVGSNWEKGGKKKKATVPAGVNPKAGKAIVRAKRNSLRTDFTHATMGWTRARTIEVLNNMRGGMKEGTREKTLLVYAQSLRLAGYQKDVLRDGLELNGTFDPPLPQHQAKHALRFATPSSPKNIPKGTPKKYWKRIGYKFRTATIVKWLDITVEEQRHQSIKIVGQAEKNRRKRLTVNATARRVEEAFEKMPEGTTQVEIGKAVGKGQATVSNSLAALGLKTASKAGRPGKNETRAKLYPVRVPELLLLYRERVS